MPINSVLARFVPDAWTQNIVVKNINIPILPIGIDFCKQKLTAPPLRPIWVIVPENLLFHSIAQYLSVLRNVQVHCKMSKWVMQSNNWAMWANMVSINMCWHISDVLRCLAETEKQPNIIRPSPASQEGPNQKPINCVRDIIHISPLITNTHDMVHPWELVLPIAELAWASSALELAHKNGKIDLFLFAELAQLPSSNCISAIQLPWKMLS